MNNEWKKLYPAILLLLAVITAGRAQEFNREKISDALLERIQDKPSSYHSIGVLLQEQVDLQAMEEYLQESKATLEERAYLVITSLQQKASQTQPGLLEEIKKMPGIEQSSVQPLWITNAIFLDAGSEGVAALSRHPAVAWLGLYQTPELHDGEAAGEASPAKLNSTERGLAAIGATQMWGMGYTGYGTRALIVDSGQDGFHPALHNQFLYHQRPMNQAWPNTQGTYYCGDHGTHVAGTVLGLDRLTGDTIGVAFDAQWMGAPIDLNNCGEYVGGSPVNSVTVFQWAINPDGDPATIDDMPHVINNSWGRSDPTLSDCLAPFLGNTIEALYTAGIAVVWSAGNNGPGSQTIGNPAMTNNGLVRIMSVGNVNAGSPSFPISNDSSRGPSVCGGTGSLLIKPEVCAPGSNVRSSVLNGGYQQFSGTSMAAPHVAGAVLLLKEAFPNLTGEEILLALYFSAIDLGPAGEDNAYGMGIINLPAAYQYLLNEGHEPALPTEAPNDVVLLRIETPPLNCEEQAVTRLLVLNNGTETITSLDIRHAVLSGGVPNYFTHHWEGTIEPGAQQTIQMPPLPAAAGSFEYVAEVFMANGQPDARRLNNQLKTRVNIIEEEFLVAGVSGNEVVCQGGQALLQSLTDSLESVRWYDEPEAGSLLAEGPAVLLPVGDESFTVYMEATTKKKAGRASNQGGLQRMSDDNNGLVFDAYYPFTIKTVKIYAEETGARLVTLRNNSNGASATKIVSVPETGEQRVELNLSVDVGEDWELYLKGGKALGLNLGGHNYPLTVPNVLSIKRSTQGPVFYDYFYDWEVEYNYFCGRTAVEVPVLATENPLPVVFSPADATIDLSSGSNEIAFSDLTQGAASWLWDFGDGTTSTMPNPVHAYTDTGQYQVILTVVGPDGCASSASGTVVVLEGTLGTGDRTGRKYEMAVFPNPAREAIFLSVNLIQPRDAEVFLADMLGRPVWRRQLELSPNEAVEIPVSGLPAGLYSLVVQVDGVLVGERVVVRR
ncbi:MAG: S8 family serine peptidase [Phaeodactylibacter sp.]|nr:S8 family serine peptidase [Phaeodactylibacter sp.]